MTTQADTYRYVDPPILEHIFGVPRWAWLWLIIRLYVGYTWLSAGLEKLENPGWMQGGTVLKGFWEKAVVVPAAPARPLIAFDWYRGFILAMLESNAYVWFSKLVVFGEVLVGVALILGLFTGLAAFFGGFMNWNYMMAGTASINPLLFIFAILLIMVWKTAGWWGVDRWMLKWIGTPWQPGTIFERAN